MKPSFLFILLFISGLSNAIETSEFTLCYDFGCKSTKEISFNDQQWESIVNIFDRPALSPWLEKQKIRQAIALMESISGSKVGTSQDKGGNYPGQDIPFQQDCIDESTNTHQFLNALQNKNLLQWHQVDLKQRRIVWFATHWTASIRELYTDKHFAVDSWYRDNGELPYIQTYKNWKRKKSFSELLNP